MLNTRLWSFFVLVIMFVSGLTNLCTGTVYAGWVYDDGSRDWFYYETITYDKEKNVPAVRLDDEDDDNIVTETRVKTGWHKDKDGFTYYLDPDDGHMLTGYHTIGQVEYLFIPERNPGNYFDISEDGEEQSWEYRPNGISSYGSLLIDKDKKKHDKKKRDEESTEDNTEDSVGDIVEDIERDIATESEAATESEIATASELEGDDVDTSDDGDEHIHSHADGEGTHCIATDSWDEILAHPENYHDCIDAGCTSLLYLTGSEIYIPTVEDSIDGSIYDKPNMYTSISEGVYNEADTVNYPIYVSLISIDDGAMTLAQAYALDELSEVAMCPGLTRKADGSLRVTNTHGITDTWLYHFLNQGDDEGLGYDTYGFSLENADGDYTDYVMHLPGYKVTYYDEDADDYVDLAIHSEDKVYSLGYEAESSELNEEDYWEWYITGDLELECMDGMFRSDEMSLWLASEQELDEIDAPGGDDLESHTLSMQVSTHILEDEYMDRAASTWRSDEAYWIRSTPSAYHSDEQYEELGMGATVGDDEAEALRMEYFETNEGPAHWSERHAVRLFFGVSV